MEDKDDWEFEGYEPDEDMDYPSEPYEEDEEEEKFSYGDDFFSGYGKRKFSKDYEVDEKVLQHLARSIIGEREVDLSIVDEETSSADVDNRKIYIHEKVKEADDDEELRRFWKALSIHESAHIVMTGSLLKEFKGWTKSKTEFQNYKDVINVLEDVRIENAMTKVLPQSRKYLVEFLDKFVIKADGMIKTNNLIMALRCALENKTTLPYDMVDETGKSILAKAKPTLDKAIKLFNDMKVLDGNWDNCVECARKIHDLFNDLKEKSPEFKTPEEELAGDMEELKKEIDKISKGMSGLGRGVKDFAKLAEDLGEEIEKAEDLGEDTGKLTKELAKIAGKLIKAEEDYEKEYSKKEEKEDELSSKAESLKLAEMKREEEKIIEGLIKRDDLEKKKKSGKLAKKDLDGVKESIDEVEIEPEKEKGLFETLDREEGFGVPDVRDFSDKEDFSKDEYNSIPNIPKAMEIGDEIASTLKRHLHLKKALIKRKTSGKLDMKRIRKQYVQYDDIRDTDVFSRGRAKLPDHSVMVMLDLSGSMGGKKLRQAKQALTTLSRTLVQLRVNHSIRGYCAYHGSNKIADVIIKEFSKEETDYSFVDVVNYPRDSGSWYENRDGDSFRLGAEKLGNQEGTKLMIVISDGSPYHGGTSYTGHKGMKDTELAIQQIETRGIKTIGISIDRGANEYIKKVFKNHFFFDDDIEDLAEGLTEVYLQAIKY